MGKQTILQQPQNLPTESLLGQPTEILTGRAAWAYPVPCALFRGSIHFCAWHAWVCGPQGSSAPFFVQRYSRMARNSSLYWMQTLTRSTDTPSIYGGDYSIYYHLTGCFLRKISQDSELFTRWRQFWVYRFAYIYSNLALHLEWLLDERKPFTPKP